MSYLNKFLKNTTEELVLPSLHHAFNVMSIADGVIDKCKAIQKVYTTIMLFKDSM